MDGCLFSSKIYSILCGLKLKSKKPLNLCMKTTLFVIDMSIRGQQYNRYFLVTLKDRAPIRTLIDRGKGGHI